MDFTPRNRLEWRRYRSGSIFGPGPRAPRDRNQRARYRYLVGAYHRGRQLTRAQCDVADALLSFLGGDGRCDPSVQAIMLRAECWAQSTVYEALNVLELLGLVRRQRRLVRGQEGTRQTSNAYVLLPSQAPAILPAPPREPFSTRNISSSGSSPAIGAGPRARPMPAFPASLQAAAEASQQRFVAAWQAGRAGLRPV